MRDIMRVESDVSAAIKFFTNLYREFSSIVYKVYLASLVNG